MRGGRRNFCKCGRSSSSTDAGKLPNFPLICRRLGALPPRALPVPRSPGQSSSPARRRFPRQLGFSHTSPASARALRALRSPRSGTSVCSGVRAIQGGGRCPCSLPPIHRCSILVLSAQRARLAAALVGPCSCALGPTRVCAPPRQG